MSKRYNRSGVMAGAHTSDQIARRAAAIERLRKLLAEWPRSAYELAARLELPSSTVYGYLRTLQDLGEARQTTGVDARGRKLWAADEQAPAEAAEKVKAEHASRAWVVPARQVGMPRHWMDVALFGPAPGAAA